MELEEDEESLEDWALRTTGITIEELVRGIQENYDRVGVELVSPIFDFVNSDYWGACIKQIDEDLQWNEAMEHGGWCDDEPHLHCHSKYSF
jgi:hypothetical protein